MEPQDCLQDARDTTEAHQVQVGGGCKRWGPTRDRRPGLVSAYFLNDGGGDTKGRGRAAAADLRGPSGSSSRRWTKAAGRNSSRCMGN